MRIYIEEWGTPVLRVETGPMYYVLTATTFSPASSVRNILTGVKQRLALPDDVQLHDYRRGQRQRAEQLYKVLGDIQWGDTWVTCFVVDKSRAIASIRKAQFIEYSFDKLIRRHLAKSADKSAEGVSLVLDSRGTLRTVAKVASTIEEVDEVLLVSSPSSAIQLADMFSYAAWRKLAYGDATYFNHVAPLFDPAMPTFTLTGKPHAQPEVSLLPAESQDLGLAIAHLRFMIDENAKLKLGRGLFKASSKSEMFSASIARFRPLTTSSEFEEFIRDLHQYIYESSNKGSAIRYYVSSHAFSVVDDINRLRVYFSHDLEMDQREESKIQAQFRCIGGVLKKYTGSDDLPDSASRWEEVRKSLLAAVHTLLQQCLCGVKS